MNIIILSGSHREKSQSEKVSLYIQSNIKNQKELNVDIISLAKNPIPFIDDDFLNGNDENWARIWKPISSKLKEADGIIIVTPEWHGMSPSGVKNFLLLCKANEVGHKAGLIVSVSAGMGGSYPIAELRMNSSKNTRICYIPEHLIIRDCHNVLNDKEPQSSNDSDIRKRISYTTNLFIEYSSALKKVRDSGIIDLKNFPNGM
ncbi:NADPH-dependent FMN reductase [Fluviispira multicolorata]|uniref:NADPH-dependent oxidoreductase n=1 Tax=Fluviispira multicolorata TaxID=2654512 RepID=A0A833JDA8_9BACT|nr:NAD(P)H-dependent oxidoreductase [Fluviispira multicolorata]KAB8031805.1 NADPH-dependent oxidoreductase [Fluviispira multicolorata]